MENNEPLSPFGEFLSNLKGYVLYYKGRIIDKWEAFLIIQDSQAILTGKSPIHGLVDIPELLSKKK